MNIDALQEWFRMNARKLPWREDCTPYRVWVSEVMLQQTQAVVVIPYFHRWMQKFPVIESLALASKEEVLKMWEGLGYYSRALRLYEGAQWLVRNRNGNLPETRKSLEEIPGIGPYTAGAILSFAFKKKAAAIDGNVLRVLTRFYAIEDCISKLLTHRRVGELLDVHLERRSPFVTMEALIELGALHCKKEPECHLCPIKKGCKAFALGKVSEFPKRKKRDKIVKLTRIALIYQYKDLFLVHRVEGARVMSGLYEFYSSEKIDSLPKRAYPLDKVVHSYTKYRVTISPYLCPLQHKMNLSGYKWLDQESLLKLPFSAGHRKILLSLLDFLSSSS